MGIAMISGVIASLDSRNDRRPLAKWESHTPGTLTPITESLDPSTPNRFIACVSRQESAKKLKQTFSTLSRTVEVVASQNLEAVQQSDVILLWYGPHPSAYPFSHSAGKHSCKPQLAHSILDAPGIREALGGKLLVSILAGVTIAQISHWVLPSTTVLRAMPNTPCKVTHSSSPHRLRLTCRTHTFVANVDTRGHDCHQHSTSNSGE